MPCQLRAAVPPFRPYGAAPPKESKCYLQRFGKPLHVPCFGHCQAKGKREGIQAGTTSLIGRKQLAAIIIFSITSLLITQLAHGRKVYITQGIMKKSSDLQNPALNVVKNVWDQLTLISENDPEKYEEIIRQSTEDVKKSKILPIPHCCLKVQTNKVP